MNRRTQLFWASLALTAILIFSLCGFALVDLSSDRYMPGQFTHAIDILSFDATGIRFELFGQAWEITPASVGRLLEPLERFRGVLPEGVFWGKVLAEFLGGRQGWQG